MITQVGLRKSRALEFSPISVIKPIAMGDFFIYSGTVKDPTGKVLQEIEKRSQVAELLPDVSPNVTEIVNNSLGMKPGDKKTIGFYFKTPFDIEMSKSLTFEYTILEVRTKR